MAEFLVELVAQAQVKGSIHVKGVASEQSARDYAFSHLGSVQWKIDRLDENSCVVMEVIAVKAEDPVWDVTVELAADYTAPHIRSEVFKVQAADKQDATAIAIRQAKNKWSDIYNEESDQVFRAPKAIKVKKAA